MLVKILKIVPRFALFVVEELIDRVSPAKSNIDSTGLTGTVFNNSKPVDAPVLKLD
ncbi:hypothetical protein [Kaarinaea lacus]